MVLISRASLVGLALVACSCSRGESRSQSAEVKAPEAQAAILVTSAPSSAGPTDADHFAQISEALHQAQSRWSESDVASYRLTITENRNYRSKRCTWISVVSNGVVVETSTTPTSPTTCGDDEWTVEDLHDMVSGMLSDIDEFSAPEFGHHQLDVTFDTDGVPVVINFDLANGDDEERAMQVALARES